MEALRRELTAFYREASRIYQERVCYADKVDEVWAALDAWLAANPDCPAVLLKAKLHEESAARFEPVIFPHSPFYYELGLKASENWGVPGLGPIVGGWLLARRGGPLCWDTEAAHRLQAFHVQMTESSEPIALWTGSGGFDADHHCLNYSKLLKVGINGILGEIQARRQAPDLSPAQQAFLEAAERSNRALLKISARFADKAETLLETEKEPGARRFLRMIADTARRVPAWPPKTFYEGLAAAWFLRESIATLESIGISVIGHLDRLLINLYRADLAAGRLTESEARDLLARWLLPTDIKFHIEDNPWPETSTCLELGGCDETGTTVFNELTRLIIEVHAEHGLLNPKLNCRFGSASPPEYLDLLSHHILNGHNVFALQNDDVLIPACVRYGKTEAEARLYVNGGCQETIVEGVEHSAGAYYYFNLPRVLDLCLQPAPELPEAYRTEPVLAQIPQLITSAASFAEFYAHFMATLTQAIAIGAAWRVEMGRNWPEIHPCPLFSSGLEGCLENARDYTAGGAAYNPSGICLVGLGTLTDSLYAIDLAVFKENWLSLEELRQVLARNWEGEEALRRRFLKLPNFGHGHEGVDDLAARFSRELAAFVRTLPNERGEHFQPSFFVYYFFAHMGRQVRATPDGRRAGEMLSQGVAPARTRPPENLTDTVRSLSRIDFKDYPGNSVLDVQLPLGARMAADSLASFTRTFAKLGGPTLQFNCVSPEDMRDAQVHPEKHQHLTVRISGLSARFVALERAVQDEIIDRTLMAV